MEAKIILMAFGATLESIQNIKNQKDAHLTQIMCEFSPKDCTLSNWVLKMTDQLHLNLENFPKKQ